MADCVEENLEMDLEVEDEERATHNAERRASLRLLRGGATISSTSESQKLEALKVLSLALLREVEALNRNAAQGAERRVNLAEEVRRFESDLILSALIRTNGRQRQAARLLGMKVTTLHAKIKRYRIDAEEIARGATELRVKAK